MSDTKKYIKVCCSENKHGEWLTTPTGWIYCSVCGEEPPNESNYATNFCPNCGADMRSEAREYLEYGKLIAKGIAQGLRGDLE